MENFNSLNIFKVLLANWKKLSLVAIVSIGVSSLITSPFIITPDYKSGFTVYPTNLIPFGKESGAEQLFEFFSSDDIKSNLTTRFKLFEHYKIDPKEPRSQDEFNKAYHSNILIKFTRYQSIEVSIIDISPVFAQQLASGMIEEVNKLIRQRKKEKYTEVIDLYAQQLKAKRLEIDSIENKLKYMRTNYGLLDIKTQTKNVSKNSGKKDLNPADKELLNNLKEHSGEFTILQSRFNIELENYRTLKQTYDKNVTDFNGNLSYITVISPPNLPDKKNSPHRMVIVLVITLSSLLLSSVLIVLKDKKGN